MKNSANYLLVTIGLTAGAVLFLTSHAQAAENSPVYRLYNPNSGEHFYTKDANERISLARGGWNSEGIGWISPDTSQLPVYRLYNPNAGDHHYTTSAGEKDFLLNVGWRNEGISWYSDDAQTLPIYRAYNPHATTGTHNYTESKVEQTHLIQLGWLDEHIGWYAQTPTDQQQALKEIFAFEPASGRLTFTFYKMLGADYLFEAKDPAIAEQGGSGTVGFYRVTPTGTVMITDANGNQ